MKIVKVKLSKRQAFVIWSKCANSLPYRINEQMWYIFGGSESKMYRDYMSGKTSRAQNDN